MNITSFGQLMDLTYFLMKFGLPENTIIKIELNYSEYYSFVKDIVFKIGNLVNPENIVTQIHNGISFTNKGIKFEIITKTKQI